jgi:hypothetical protein
MPLQHGIRIGKEDQALLLSLFGSTPLGTPLQADTYWQSLYLQACHIEKRLDKYP